MSIKSGEEWNAETSNISCEIDLQFYIFWTQFYIVKKALSDYFNF